ncbi:MAG: hypothetical protein ABEI78_00355 [Candidatus Nanohaloarchaea archaeon]
MRCSKCGGQEIMEGNPIAEHVKFICQVCGKERKMNTNHLRPETLQIEFSGEQEVEG